MNRDEIALEAAKVFLVNIDVLKANADNTPIEELNFSIRTSNIFRNAEIKTIDDLEKKYNDIPKWRNAGRKVIEEIETKLKDYRLAVKEENEYEKIAKMSYLMADAMIKEGKKP